MAGLWERLRGGNDEGGDAEESVEKQETHRFLFWGDIASLSLSLAVVRGVATTEVFVADPLRLPDIEGAFGVIVAGFLGFWVIELERVVVTEARSPFPH